MKTIKVSKRDLKNGRNITPFCKQAKIVHLKKDRYAISFPKDIPSIGFKSRTFTRFSEDPPDEIVSISAHEELCSCCGGVNEEIVLRIHTRDGIQYQINGADDLIVMVHLDLE